MSDEKIGVDPQIREDDSTKNNTEIRFSKEQVGQALIEYVVNHRMFPADGKAYITDFFWELDGSWKLKLTVKP